ncbi:DUF2683 family protein [Mucilaginibacter gotjawali]|uniref:Uncharacterized protein n=2 Tax=Mucilaginibacter gotjawali TaxID=1550579 RepID=A0A839SJC1_9SPHI|nr:DUF2683 family protein [Mucilaginibacter gotjawali]MBB3057403.1 hypothetical protein [Mucilaginibacter gotjawali]BAU55478.1 hypothetical protein MgSA37_03667 [Mucilaginibacter gotjawali]
MDIIVIHPENEAQQKALQVILDGFKVPYENEPPSDATEYLLSTNANKEWLDTAMIEAKKGEGVEIKLEDLWK